VDAVRSPAYTAWLEARVDAAEVTRMLGRSSGGVVPLTTDQTQALCRAAVVATIAAFQAYVVALFETMAQHLTGSRTAVDRLKDRYLRRGARARFNTPNHLEVERLFASLLDVLLPGESIWDNVSTARFGSNRIASFMEIHLGRRHAIAHGDAPPTLSPADVREGLDQFTRIVRALDARAGILIAMRTGRAPW
jgi:hypothetical protein